MNILFIFYFFIIILNNNIGYNSLIAPYSEFIGQLSFNLIILLSLLFALLKFNKLGALIIFSTSILIALKYISSFGLELDLVKKSLSSAIVSLGATYFIFLYPRIFNKTITLFLSLNLIVLVLQFSGVFEVLHYWNSLYITEHGSTQIYLSNLFFENNLEFGPQYQQLRSPGFFHSSAVAAIFMMGVLAYRWGSFSARVGVFDMILISSIIIMCAKISFIFMIFIIITGYYTACGSEVAVWRSRFIALCFLLIFLLLLFPGALIDSYGINAFYTSSGVRMIDFIGSFDIPGLESALLEAGASVSFHVFQDELNSGGLSGLRQIIYILPFAPILIFIYKNKIKDMKYNNYYEYRKIKFIVFMLCFSFATTPFIGILPAFLFVGPLILLFIKIK